MASIQKKGESWYCQFTYQKQRHSVTIGKVDETEARASAARIDYLLMRIRQRLLEVPSGMEIATFIQNDGKPLSIAQDKPKPQVVRFGEFRDQYLRTFSNGALEKNTLYTARIHLQHLATTLGENLLLADLDLPQLQKHIDRRQADVAAITIKKEIDTLRAAWNWACRMRLTQGPFPNAGLVYPKAEDKLPFMTWAEIHRRLKAGGDAKELWECLYLTEPEVSELLDHVQEQEVYPWVYPAFVFVAHTGARRSEMMRTRTEDLDLTDGVVTLREKKRVKGRRTHRRVPMSTRATTALTVWLREHPGGPHLFGTGDGLLSPKAAEVGFDGATRGSKWQTLRGWHVLRHSFISALASRGVDQRLIDDFVGHQTEEQRRRYRHLYPSLQHEAIQSVFG